MEIKDPRRGNLPASERVLVGVTEPVDEFTAFVAASSARLLRAAWLLTFDRDDAQDLTQLAFAKTFAAWQRVRRDDAESYARRVLVNSYIDWWRRAPWRERSTAQVPEAGVIDDHARQTDERTALTVALKELTRRERTVVVLRYYLDVSEADVADQLNVSAGTVKSTASKALAKLRRSTALAGFQPPTRDLALEDIS